MKGLRLGFRRIVGYGWWVGTTALTTALLLNAGRLLILRSKAQDVAAPVPYTVILAETVSLAGASKPGMHLTTAVRSDGSRATRLEHDRISDREKGT